MATESALRKAKRDQLILELVEGGATYAMVREALRRRDYGDLSENRIGVVVRRELAKVCEQRRGLAEHIFDLKIEQLNAIIRTNFGVINAPCRFCEGRGTMGQDPDKAEGTLLTCEKCKGDGKAYAPRDRKGASMEMRLAIDQQCKMLGLYAPEKFAITDPDGNALDFSEELAGISDDELERELTAYKLGVDDAHKEMQEKRERVEP